MSEEQIRADIALCDAKNADDATIVDLEAFVEAANLRFREYAEAALELAKLKRCPACEGSGVLDDQMTDLKPCLSCDSTGQRDIQRELHVQDTPVTECAANCATYGFWCDCPPSKEG